VIIVSRATKIAGKCCSGGRPEDERIGYVRVAGLFAIAFRSPRHGQTAATASAFIQGYGTGCDHTDLLQRWLFRYWTFNSQMQTLVFTLLIQREGCPPLIHSIDKLDRVQVKGMKGTLCLRFQRNARHHLLLPFLLRSFRASVALALFSPNLSAESPVAFCRLALILVTEYILLQAC
jgi:hypothetical protein